MGHVAGKFAIETAIDKAKSVGVAYVSVHHTNHFGAAGYYAWLVAQRGMIGISMANDIPSVAAPGSSLGVPTNISGLAFGGQDGRTLFITGAGKYRLYRVRLPVAGEIVSRK